ncbi:MAG: hypothetical protein LBD47_11630, partial [Treponema sp.]|nr:hypothetical protein [Treponema sp.]
LTILSRVFCLPRKKQSSLKFTLHLLENIETNRVVAFTEISENSLIKEIADFLHTSNFIFEKNNMIKDYFSWERRLNFELELLYSL